MGLAASKKHKKKTDKSQNTATNLGAFAYLPLDIQLVIINSLPLQDLLHLTQLNQYFYHFIMQKNKTYFAEEKQKHLDAFAFFKTLQSTYSLHAIEATAIETIEKQLQQIKDCGGVWASDANEDVKSIRLTKLYLRLFECMINYNVDNTNSSTNNSSSQLFKNSKLFWQTSHDGNVKLFLYTELVKLCESLARETDPALKLSIVKAKFAEVMTTTFESIPTMSSEQNKLYCQFADIAVQLDKVENLHKNNNKTLVVKKR